MITLALTTNQFRATLALLSSAFSNGRRDHHEMAHRFIANLPQIDTFIVTNDETRYARLVHILNVADARRTAHAKICCASQLPVSNLIKDQHNG